MPIDNSYKLPINKVIESLSSDSNNGLSSDESKQRLLTHGYNKFSTEKETSPFQIFISQFKSILIIILLFASVVSFFLGDLVESIAIFAVVLLNSIFGFIQEYKADLSVKALKNLVSLSATLIRDGDRVRVKHDEIVPGDIVLLDSGDKVPADIQIIESNKLKVDESILTGESCAVDKSNEIPHKKIESIGDITNLVYMGTIITDGNAKGITIRTGKKNRIR